MSTHHRVGPVAARLGGIGSTVAVALCTTLALGWSSAPAAAATPATPGAVGHDVSAPQCGRPLPPGGAFGVVGVTGGRPFSANPCLATQFRWATGRPAAAGVFVNTGNPAPTSSFYWPASGTRDPALCRDRRSTRDPGCAYDYGWHAAADALAVADRTDRSIRTLTWWLDVETANTWHGDGVSNTAVVQGALDQLRGSGIAVVGLYSTGYQWRTITGGYAAASAARYRGSWRAEFTPRVPLESVPLWIATVGGAAAARTACSTSFTGARTRLVQFRDGSAVSADLRC